MSDVERHLAGLVEWRGRARTINAHHQDWPDLPHAGASRWCRDCGGYLGSINITLGHDRCADCRRPEPATRSGGETNG